MQFVIFLLSVSFFTQCKSSSVIRHWRALCYLTDNNLSSYKPLFENYIQKTKSCLRRQKKVTNEYVQYDSEFIHLCLWQLFEDAKCLEKNEKTCFNEYVKLENDRCYLDFTSTCRLHDEIKSCPEREQDRKKFQVQIENGRDIGMFSAPYLNYHLQLHCEYFAKMSTLYRGFTARDRQKWNEIVPAYNKHMFENRECDVVLHSFKSCLSEKGDNNDKCLREHLRSDGPYIALSERAGAKCAFFKMKLNEVTDLNSVMLRIKYYNGSSSLSLGKNNVARLW